MRFLKSNNDNNTAILKVGQDRTGSKQLTDRSCQLSQGIITAKYQV